MSGQVLPVRTHSDWGRTALCLENAVIARAPQICSPVCHNGSALISRHAAPRKPPKGVDSVGAATLLGLGRKQEAPAGSVVVCFLCTQRVNGFMDLKHGICIGMSVAGNAWEETMPMSRGRRKYGIQG